MRDAMNDANKPLRTPPSPGEPVVQTPARRSPGDSSPILAEIPKTYLAVGILAGVFIAGISLRTSIRAIFAADATAATTQTVRDYAQDARLDRLEVKVDYVIEGQRWTNDRLLEISTKERLNPPPIPSPSAVQTPALPAVTNRPR